MLITNILTVTNMFRVCDPLTAQSEWMKLGRWLTSNQIDHLWPETTDRFHFQMYSQALMEALKY